MNLGRSYLYSTIPKPFYTNDGNLPSDSSLKLLALCLFANKVRTGPR